LPQNNCQLNNIGSFVCYICIYVGFLSYYLDKLKCLKSDNLPKWWKDMKAICKFNNKQNNTFEHITFNNTPVSNEALPNVINSYVINIVHLEFLQLILWNLMKFADYVGLCWINILLSNMTSFLRLTDSNQRKLLDLIAYQTCLWEACLICLLLIFPSRHYPRSVKISKITRLH